MTTDAGIDLVLYAPNAAKAVTVQVKTNLKPKAAGGRGKLAVDWWLPQTCPAELVGLVNLQDDQVWLFQREEFASRAQQYSGGRLHLYFYVDPSYPARPSCHERDFAQFRIERRIEALFGVSKMQIEPPLRKETESTPASA